MTQIRIHVIGLALIGFAQTPALSATHDGGVQVTSDEEVPTYTKTQLSQLNNRLKIASSKQFQRQLLAVWETYTGKLNSMKDLAEFHKMHQVPVIFLGKGNFSALGSQPNAFLMADKIFFTPRPILGFLDSYFLHFPDDNDVSEAKLARYVALNMLSTYAHEMFHAKSASEKAKKNIAFSASVLQRWRRKQQPMLKELKSRKSSGIGMSPS